MRRALAARLAHMAQRALDGVIPVRAIGDTDPVATRLQRAQLHAQGWGQVTRFRPPVDFATIPKDAVAGLIAHTTMVPKHPPPVVIAEASIHEVEHRPMRGDVAA